jgi:hypothetical protein
VVVNETPDASRRTLKVEGRTVSIPVPAQGARLALFERGSAKLVALTPGEPLPD